MLGYTPRSIHPPDQVHLLDQVHPPRPGTPPRSRHPPRPGTPPLRADTPQTRYTCWTRYIPPGPGTPPDQVHPPKNLFAFFYIFFAFFFAFFFLFFPFFSKILINYFIICSLPHPHPPRAVHAGRSGQQVGSMHPTGMHSCWCYIVLSVWRSEPETIFSIAWRNARLKNSLLRLYYKMSLASFPFIVSFFDSKIKKATELSYLRNWYFE